jgi:predicted ATPase
VPNGSGQLIADALHCTPRRALQLTRLVHDKTGGNPFFAIQFLHALAEERLLAFDHAASRWNWNLERIRGKGYTDNVVDLMVGKLTRLPAETQTVLQLLACLGNVAEIRTLAIVLETPEAQVEAALWEAIRQELVESADGAYRFSHDRMQEAAYSLIPDALRAATHLRIGRRLADRTPPGQHGATLITARAERDQLAGFNLVAGKRAKEASAYASALTYLIAGTAMLAEDCWERQQQLSFALALERAECEFLTGALAEAGQRLATLSSLVVTIIRYLGIDWSPHPTEADVRREYERIWSQLGSRAIEELIELPLMSDPTALTTMDILTRMGPPSMDTDVHLFSLIICRAVNLSLQSGNCDASCFAYVRLGMVAGSRFGNYQAAYRFGRLGHDLLERHGLKRYQARTLINFAAAVWPWTKDIRAARDLLRRGLEAAVQMGDLVYAVCGHHVTTNLLATGEPLADAQREAESVLAFAQKARFGYMIDIAVAQLELIRTLRGLTPTFWLGDDLPSEALRLERRFSFDPDPQAECSYLIREIHARFLRASIGWLSRSHRGCKNCCGHCPPTLRRLSIIFTPPSPARLPVLPRRTQSGGGRSTRCTPIIFSCRSGRRPVRRISPTAPPWWAPRSRGWRDVRSTPNVCTNRRSVRRAPVASFTMRRWPTSWPRGFTRCAGSTNLPACTCSTPVISICAGAQMARCGD